MRHPAITAAMEESINEGHLRLAVLLDLIEDDLAADVPLDEKIAALRLEFEEQTAEEEDILARHAPASLAGHRHGHDRMKELLRRLASDYESGADIRPTIKQVLALFTQEVLPADVVFTGRTFTVIPTGQ